MSDCSTTTPGWLVEWMKSHGIRLWGAADLHDIATPQDEAGQGFVQALSYAIPMSPDIMVTVQEGPNAAYADEYARVNHQINDLSEGMINKWSSSVATTASLAGASPSSTW